MAKRKGRKDLINEIKSLRSQAGEAETMREDANARYDALLRRFHVLGKYSEPVDFDSTIKTVEVKPIPFGIWGALDNTILDNDSTTFKHMQDTLAESLVKSLMEHGYIQFVEGDREPIRYFTTVGAKIYVVPWEQMSKGVHPWIYKRISEAFKE